MDVIIPSLIATLMGYSFLADTPQDNTIKTLSETKKELNIKNNSTLNNYVSDSQLQINRNNFRKPDMYSNTTILNNPGFVPVMDNLYFFKNYYQLTIKKYKIEGETATTEANINLTLDSSQVTLYTDGQEIVYDKTKYLDGIVIRAQLLPISDKEDNFRLIYEIENTDAAITKSNGTSKSAGSVINSLVGKEVTEKEDYKVLKNGWHIYTGRLYSIDEKFINPNDPILVNIGPYRIEIKLSKGGLSNEFNNPQNIVCKNKLCETMKQNTIMKKNKNSI